MTCDVTLMPIWSLDDIDLYDINGCKRVSFMQREMQAMIALPVFAGRAGEKGDKGDKGDMGEGLGSFSADLVAYFILASN